MREEAKRAAIYVRVSTEDQASNGHSLAMQKERLRAYCRAQGWAVHEVYRDDGASAKTLDRPALRRLLEDARAGQFQAVLVFKLDRITRSVRDLGHLLELFERRKIALVSLGESLDTSTAVGRLVLNVLGSVAQWEREATAERISDVLRHKRDNLEVYSSTPYGFSRRGDRLVPVMRELDVVRTVHRLRRKGKTLRAMASSLNERRIPTRRGRKWAPATLLYILKNDLYRPYLVRKENRMVNAGS